MSLEPKLQTFWDWRAVGNWVGGGTGTGIMVIAALLALAGIDSYVYAVLACVFVSAGLFSVLLKIGRPLRSLYVFRNPFTSWMSREAWVGVLLLPAGLLAWWLHSLSWLIVAALLAWSYLYCQAWILKDCRGIAAWRTDEIVALIMTMGLVEGAAIILVLGTVVPAMQFSLGSYAFTIPALAAEINTTGILLAVLLLIAARSIGWRRYYLALINNAPLRTIDKLKQTHKPYLYAGNLLPALLLVTAMFAGSAAGGFSVLAGLCLLVSGWTVKFVIVARAGYDQGFAMSFTPARGAGKPGPGIKPGWPT